MRSAIHAIIVLALAQALCAQEGIGVPERENRAFYPILHAADGSPQMAVAVLARGYQSPVPEAVLDAAERNAAKKGLPIGRSEPELMLARLWRAYRAGSLDDIVALYAAGEAAAVRETFADQLAELRALHGDAKHEVAQKVLVGPYLIVTTFTTTKEGRRIVWEEVLVREGAGYRFTQTLPVTSTPQLLLSAVAAAQRAGRGQPVDVTGWTIVPMSLGADGGWHAVAGATLDDGAVLLAWKTAYASPVVLETYAGDDADLQWLKGIRSLYQANAPIGELNALWDLNPGESARDDKPIDPLYWLGSQTPTLVLGAIRGPQGPLFVVAPEGGDVSRILFVRTAAGRRLASGLIWTDLPPKDAGVIALLNRLLNGFALPDVLTGK